MFYFVLCSIAQSCLTLCGPVVHYFIYWPLLCWGLCCVRAFSGCGERGLLSSFGARASRCGDISRCSAGALGTWAQWLWCTGLVPRSMWDLLGPGMELLSPTLAGGFFFFFNCKDNCFRVLHLAGDS